MTDTENNSITSRFMCHVFGHPTTTYVGFDEWECDRCGEVVSGDADE